MFYDMYIMHEKSYINGSLRRVCKIMHGNKDDDNWRFTTRYMRRCLVTYVTIWVCYV